MKNPPKTFIVLFSFIVILAFGLSVPVKGVEDFYAAKSITSAFAPAVATEKSNFAGGEQARIFGSGFTEFEEIRLSVFQRDETLRGENLVGEWLVFADFSGNFSTVWNTYEHSNGGSFRIQAASAKNFAENDFTVMLAGAANLDQCANGGEGQPIVPCSGANWVNGNLNSNKAHYLEGGSISYRMRLSGLTAGSTGNTLTIQWDTTKNGKHAVDYLTNFDHSETLAMGNNPCSNVTGCSLGTFSTFPIPVDPAVTRGFDETLGTADDIVQLPGLLTMYGGVITGTSGYTPTGSFAGNAESQITITFTATTASPVLAWGGHISTRSDWGQNNSAISIQGSPYHSRLVDLNSTGGNQDRSVTQEAVVYPAQITIIKDARPNTAQPFSFTSSGQAAANFSLIDDGTNTANSQSFANLTNFGAGNNVVVTENAVTNSYNLFSIVCDENPAGGGGTVNSTVSLNQRQANIVLEEGEIVTCMFTNILNTTAAASVGGRIADENNRGVPGVSVSIRNTSTEQMFRARTDARGEYRFDQLTAGDVYVVTVRHRKYVFGDDSRTFVLNENLSEVNFTADSR